MSKLIANRYELVPDLPDLAIDHKSAEQDLVKIWRSPQPKHTDLFEFFMTRSKEIRNLNHPGLVRLFDYGYDGPTASYYLVYENITGKQLSGLLQKDRLSLEWSLSVLFEICDALTYLHTRGISYHNLTSQDVWLDFQGDLPLKLASPGLENIRNLLNSRKKQDESALDNDGIDDDIAALREIAAELITHRLNPDLEAINQSLNDLPPAMKELFRDHSSITEVKRVLQRVLVQYHADTRYFLSLTKNAVNRLFEMGFIAKDESYLAVDLLRQESKGEIVGRAEPDGEGTAYLITTPRFRLICRPDQRAPDHQLVVVTIVCPSATGLVFERERGLPITASLQIVGLRESAPQSAQITPLLEALDEHRLEAEATKRVEVAKKSGLGIWPKVLKLQKRLLNEFQLEYTNWELTDNDSALMVELAEELDSIDLSGDERLRMTANTGRRTVIVGFYEELNGNQFKIGLAQDVDIDIIARRGSITIDNVQLENILKRQDDAFRRLKFNEAVNHSLYKLLTRPENLGVDQLGNYPLWDEKLDSSHCFLLR